MLGSDVRFKFGVFLAGSGPPVVLDPWGTVYLIPRHVVTAEAESGVQGLARGGPGRAPYNPGADAACAWAAGSEVGGAQEAVSVIWEGGGG